MRLWLDGELVDGERARISPFDHGLLVGDGVFETLRVYRGTPFAWRRHIERLRASAAGLGLEVGDTDALRDGVDRLLRANNLHEARLRITVTGGTTPPGSSRRGAEGSCAFIVAFPFEPPSPSVDVVIAPWTRNERGATAGLKTISYASNVRALAWAEARGAGEAIFANTRGELCEATGSNVFCVVDETLVTPPASAGCLLGVTRALLLELSQDAGIACDERDVPVTALATSAEAFLSSTTREVQPIAAVEGVALPAAPGPVASALSRAFRELVARDLDP